jgi:E3 ubiquitin-protein ligase RFWD2
MRNSGIASNKMFNSPFPYYLPQVFVYHKEFPMPVLAYKFSVTDPISGQEIDDQSQFISCVCWRGQSSTLLSANSSGNIKILEMD